MHMQMKHPQADNHAPKISCQEGNVLERGGREAVQDGDQRVENEENECVAGEITADFPVPSCGAKTVAVEDARLGAVDHCGPEAELADDFVQRALGDEPFFVDIAQAVESCAQQSEKVYLRGFVVVDERRMLRCGRT